MASKEDWSKIRKKKHLTELLSRKLLESRLTSISDGDASSDWQTICDFIEPEYFISATALFNNGNISMNLYREMSSKYLDKFYGNFEEIDSVGCRVLNEMGQSLS